MILLEAPADNAIFNVSTAGHVAQLPIPSELARWHEYVLQIDAAGQVSVFIDGEMIWRSTHPVPEAAYHVFLSGRALNREIYHGTVVVYRGLKYVLEGSDS